MTKPTVLITGATAGIGRHAALHLAARGFRVIATGRNTAALASLTAEAEGELTPLRLDVTDPASIAGAVEVVDRITAGRGVDVLVNNAGYGDIAPLEEMSDADLRAQYETNVFGLMAVTRAFLPRMRERGAGRIINVSSLGGTFTLPLFGAYNSTKYAVESLSDALRLELRPFGVHVSLIEPGPIRTSFSSHSLRSAARYDRDDSPYAPVLRRFMRLTERTDRMAPGPIATSRAILHAASARRPRPRYKLTLSSRLAVAFMRALPTRWSDAILRRVVGLTRRDLAPARTAPAAQLDAGQA
ncbi:MAG TPA: SDR family oxidoreductase [Kofleriaceae bacterium]|nr:SDR family oxidoreductase [Kofleriaceae bacterium]